MSTKKISDYEMEITKETPAEFVTTKHERGFIEQQIKNIQKQKDDYDTLRDAEIAECIEILKEMDKLGVVTKPVEVKEELETPINIKG
jgi:hypothetical protein